MYDTTVFERRLRRGDGERMVREGRAAVAAIEARRRERARRLAPEHARALAVWHEANLRHAAAYGEFGGDGPRLAVAASAWWVDPGPLHVF
jgi:hypothetical protein